MAQCSVEGCEKPVYARGWCSMHYSRWRRHGDLDHVSVSPGNRKQFVCDVCDAPHYCRGYCIKHYQRWRQHGDPQVRLTREWPQPTYWAVHLRLHRDRGSATQHLCAACLAPAHQWAYDHTDPAHLTGPTKPDGSLLVRYSADPDHYVPMCHSCHVAMDQQVAR